jgi:hypothetical protein
MGATHPTRSTLDAAVNDGSREAPPEAVGKMLPFERMALAAGQGRKPLVLQMARRARTKA